MMQKKEWRFVLIAAAAALLLAGVFAFGRTGRGGGIAHVYLNGIEIKTLKLATVHPGVFSLREEYGVPVDFEIRDGRVRFINVECPDHICEKTGFIGTDGQAAVCMPNKTAVVITMP